MSGVKGGRRIGQDTQIDPCSTGGDVFFLAAAGRFILLGGAPKSSRRSTRGLLLMMEVLSNQPLCGVEPVQYLQVID